MLETLDDSSEYKRISNFGVFLFIGISGIIQFILMGLFPMMGLGGIFCMPIAVVVGSIWGFCSVFVLRQRISWKVKAVILVSFFYSGYISTTC
jgi:hypothetical protein